jgi:hypothetical protein
MKWQYGVMAAAANGESYVSAVNGEALAISKRLCYNVENIISARASAAMKISAKNHQYRKRKGK